MQDLWLVNERIESDEKFRKEKSIKTDPKAGNNVKEGTEIRYL